MPPIFTAAPPVTRLPSGLLPGDKESVLQSIDLYMFYSNNILIHLFTYLFNLQILQVHAEDGDKGSPRELRYGLVSEGNPFTSFFTINETTGKTVELLLYIFNV